MRWLKSGVWCCGDPEVGRGRGLCENETSSFRWSFWVSSATTDASDFFFFFFFLSDPLQALFIVCNMENRVKVLI